MQIELHAVREDYLQSSLLLKYEKFPIFLSLRAKANASLIQYVFLRFNVLERTICYFKFNAIGNMQRNGMHLA